jgi:two-component system chemotaxis response regulator CheY
MRILIVDDDYVSRTRLKTLFSPYGDCDAVPDGDIALKMLQKAHQERLPYRLITMDVDMPGMRGQEVVQAIRRWEEENDCSKPGIEAIILMITALKDPKDMISAFRQGCEAYLNKPIRPEALGKTMAELGFQPM